MRIRKELLEDRNRNRSTVIARHGMCCASQPLAAQAGLDILKAGGTAADAAIAANAMISLVEPQNCGPGGDLFAIVWDAASGKLHGLNASGRAPYGWSLAEAEKNGVKAIPIFGPMSWSVPGCVSGWDALHGKFGKLSRAQLLEPAIRTAREGFPLTEIIASQWGFSPQTSPTMAKTYLIDGRLPRYGEIFANPELATLFETLAREGFAAFYKGDIAARLVKFSEMQGGLFAMKDFEDHTATWDEPRSTNYRGYDVWELPPNGQGIAVLQILNLLEHFDIASMQPNSAEQLHLFIEATKLVYQDRAKYYADPMFAKVPVDRLISKEYAKERVKLIDPKRAAASADAGAFKDGSDTIYLCATDAQGNMVSLIQSIYHGWGSHYAPDGLGFCLQNRGALFSLDPNHPNRLEPHKRPFHTIIPAFVTEKGRPRFAFGVMGGDFQPQGHTQVLMNLLDFGMTPQQAGEQPRVSYEGGASPVRAFTTKTGGIELEKGIGDDVKAALAGMGHQVASGTGAFGGYQGIWREEEPLRYFGGTDPRKDGVAAGF